MLLTHPLLTSTSNQAYNYWLVDMYLTIHLPLPININPGMVFPPKTFIELPSIAQHAARLTMLTLEHKDVLNANRLPVEKTGEDYHAFNCKSVDSQTQQLITDRSIYLQKCFFIRKNLHCFEEVFDIPKEGT